MRQTRIQLIPGDWPYLEGVLNRLSKNTIGQNITPLDSPTFAGLTITGLSGVLKAAAGVVSGNAAHSSLAGIGANDHHSQVHNLNGTDHTGISGTTDHFISLDTSGLPKDSGYKASDFATASGYVPYTGATSDLALGTYNITAANLNISNWNTAYGWGNWAHTTLAGYGITDAQPLATNLTSLAGLSFASASFVKMTAAGTFGLDTNSYQSLNSTLTALAGLDSSVGILKQTATDTFSKITDNSSSWNTAMKYKERADVDWDLREGSMICDGAWHDWDISGIVPANATHVQVKLYVYDNLVDRNLYVRTKGRTEASSSVMVGTQAANIPTFICGIIKIGTDTKLEYCATNDTFTEIRAVIMGWFAPVV